MASGSDPIDAKVAGLKAQLELAKSEVLKLKNENDVHPFTVKPEALEKLSAGQIRYEDESEYKHDTESKLIDWKNGLVGVIDGLIGACMTNIQSKVPFLQNLHNTHVDNLHSDNNHAKRIHLEIEMLVMLSIGKITNARLNGCTNCIDAEQLVSNYLLKVARQMLMPDPSVPLLKSQIITFFSTSFWLTCAHARSKISAMDTQINAVFLDNNGAVNRVLQSYDPYATTLSAVDPNPFVRKATNEQALRETINDIKISFMSKLTAVCPTFLFNFIAISAHQTISFQLIKRNFQFSDISCTR